MRTMYDAVTVNNIPANAAMVAGYVDGHWPTAQTLRQRFPHARIVTITVLGSNLDANVVDIEAGDCTPTSGAAWAKRKLAAGKGHPTLYCSVSAWPAVRSAVKAAGIDGKVSYWIAHYDGDPTVPAGAVAKQYTDKALGRDLDASAVVAYWPGVDPAPTAPVFTYRRPLRKGMWGADVTALKRRLHWLGYPSVPGPYFGRGLDASVRAFQRNHKLTVDGAVGPITAQTINK